MSSSEKMVVAGADGFIGGHLIKQSFADGRTHLTAVDIKPFDEWFQCDSRAEKVSVDLQDLDACRNVMRDAAVVYNLAADMGGTGFIEHNTALLIGLEATYRWISDQMCAHA